MNKFIINTKMVGIEDFGAKVASSYPEIDLTIGEPSFLTDTRIKDACIAALNDNMTHYPASYGLTSARAAIAAFETIHSNLNYSDEEVLIVNGATEGLAGALAILLNEGDEVIVPTPCYPAYESLITMNRGVFVAVDTTDTHFILTKKLLKNALSSKTKVIMLTSPNNPTGSVYSSEQLNEIVNAIEAMDIYLVMDATYGHLIFTGDYDLSALEKIKKRTIIVYSLSKTYAMTGWRLGYVLADTSILKYLAQWHHCVVTGVSNFSQYAIETALKTDVSHIVEAYHERVDYAVNRLRHMGFKVIKPQGAFYVFCSLEGFDMTGDAFSDLCAQYGLKIISGRFFGSNTHFRICCCYEMDTIIAGMDRLQAILHNQL